MPSAEIALMTDLKKLFSESTPKTPQVDFNALTGDLILSGKSIPENASRIYEPIIDWVKEYIKNPKSTTNLRLNLEYFNTATSIWLAKIMRTLATINDADKILMIHLYFDIEDFDEMESEDLKDIIQPITEIISQSKISIGAKVYGVDSNGEIIKKNTVLI